jgi:DNA-binding NtrC family response regulator
MKRKILIVDDELKLLKALKKALELEGYEVYDFSDPFEAFNFLKKRPVDLVVSDIRMAGMTGIELLGLINDLKINTPCILMTAFSSVETAVTAVKLGARDYLLKPFEILRPQSNKPLLKGLILTACQTREIP